MNANKKYVHIVGICGVATSAIAIAFHKAGWKVTGSDKGFYPPVSTHLTEAKIPYYAGWHPEHIAEHGRPDFIMMGGSGTSPSNPEIRYAAENNIPVYPYAEVLQKYFIKKNSIVTTGTWGKTTTASLLSYILIKAGLDPSYFTGGLSLSHDTGALSDSSLSDGWSVVEGDEYQVSISDKRPKFEFYSPTHLLLTSVSWDHADLYPTEKDYFETFKTLVSSIPREGTIFACTDDKGVNEVLRVTLAKIVSYGNGEKADYRYTKVSQIKNGISFEIKSRDKTFVIHSPMIGSFNAENITGCFALAHDIGIPAEKIIRSIGEFKGIKRRFEKRFEGKVTVFDCHSPTAEKAQSVLSTLRSIYTGKIIAIFEPNIGGRNKDSIAKYDGAFAGADTVIVPRLTKLKTDSHQGATLPLEGEELVAAISKNHTDAIYVDDDSEVINAAVNNAHKGDVIVFLGSHGFRGMIEEVVAALKNSRP